MNDQAFITAYGESRNGTDTWHFNPLYKRLNYSDGVRACAAAGLYWMLDILGTEAVQAYDKHVATLDGMGFINFVVTGDKAVLSLVRDEGEPPVWSKKIGYTDAPEGKWLFYMSNDGDGLYRLFLATEH